MHIAEIIWWVSFGIVIYAYIGYALILAVLNRINPNYKTATKALVVPPVTVIIPAYNEKKNLVHKVVNTLQADYPSDKLNIIVITDGSDDGSESLTFADNRVLHIHGKERLGKSEAINRAVSIAQTEILFITDANTDLNKEALALMVEKYSNQNVGGVSGEKRILKTEGSSVGSEGLYWKYESFLKREGARFYSIVGAAGELFSFKKSLFIPLSQDTILDDFVLSLQIVKQGKVIAYEPDAFAIEEPSKTIADEFVRKVRISSGVWQSLSRMKFLFSPWSNPVLFFQFFSHRFLRWTIAPLSMIVLFFFSFYLLDILFFKIMFFLQILFYLFAIIGFAFRNNHKIPSLLFIPFYYCMMNVSVAAGLIRYVRGKHSVFWLKAAR
jgi:cellulose synthase/poly-beta-1,6-N-acetylglucosamine synthase-like glycosyltransferase